MVLEDQKSADAIYDLGISHNKFGVPLPDGTPYPEHAVSIAGERAIEFLTNFDRVRDKAWDQCSFLDLGCSEGTTTLEISQMGSTAYGVEGRADAVQRGKVLKSILNFDRTHFEVGNVNDPGSYREVDGIFNAGVLYHLEDPATCLERCADNARLFIYLDTGHTPRNETELQNSRFARNFGKSYKIQHKGVELDAIDFAEPRDTSERHADGLRRGPRSGIGNSNSVWISHQSAIELMAKLGFPHHETLWETARIPRFRTCFFRTAPRPVKPIGEFLKPLPTPLPKDQAVLRIRERDIAHIHRTGEPVLLMGREPLLSQVRQDLHDANIPIKEEILLPGEGAVHRGVLNHLTKGKSGMVVVASPEVAQLIPGLMIVDRFDYAFSSFAMARQ